MFAPWRQLFLIAILFVMAIGSSLLIIKRTIDTHQETCLSREDLLVALNREYAENDLFPATDITEDWLKLTDFDPENVVKLGPVRPVRAAESGGVI